MQECARSLNPPIRSLLTEALSRQGHGSTGGHSALRALPPDKVGASVRYRTNRCLRSSAALPVSLHLKSNKCPFARMGQW
jgi:hypothetical protein